MDKQNSNSLDPEPSVERYNHVESTNSAKAIPEGHQQYLLQRHGTILLDPLPDFSDADPFNWSKPKVC